MTCHINIAKRLIQWYQNHGRHDLPWQQIATPYAVWLSEIMLQQTQVSTVIPYFQRFYHQFPTIPALSDAPIDEVLQRWTGLGYYARARNLHRTALHLTSQHGGQLPQSYDKLIALPGIGPSTAGAILSFAFGQCATICDGNVKRVLSRFYAIDTPRDSAVTQKQLWTIAKAQTPRQNTAKYNQAIMDLGATCCTRSKPACQRCPLNTDCIAFKRNRVNELPAKSTRTATPRPIKTWHVVMIQNPAGSHILLEKRPDQGIWGGLYAPPITSSARAANRWVKQLAQAPATLTKRGTPIDHALTHLQLKLCPRYYTLESDIDLPSNRWHNLQAPVPGGLPQPIAQLLLTLTHPHKEST